MSPVKNKSAQQQGYDFQTDFQNKIAAMESKWPLRCQRLYDTRSAASYLPKQPGDYLITFEGVTNLVELKASTKFNSLSQNRSVLTGAFEDHQIAEMRLYTRARGNAWAGFLDCASGEMEWWPGMAVARAYLTPRAVLSVDHRVLRIPLRDLGDIEPSRLFTRLPAHIDWRV